MGEELKDPLILPTATSATKTTGAIETPVVTLTTNPADLKVGDKVAVSVNVKRADGTTPIAGIKVDFFVTDTEGTSILGDRVETDSNGNATASDYYYVGKPEAGLDITFVAVTRAKMVT